MAAADLRDEVERLAPIELLVDDVSRGLVEIANGDGPILRELDAFRLDLELASDNLKSHFGVATLEAYGCDNKPLAILAAAEALSFLRETQLGALPQITSLRTESPSEYVKLDRRALRDLEVLESRSEQAGAATLLNTIDRTRTAMGARMLRAWLARPLMNLEELTGRQDRVERFVGDPIMRAEILDALRQVPDLERLTNRARAGRATPRDLAAIGRGLSQVPAITGALGGRSNGQASTPAGLKSCDDAVAVIESAIASTHRPRSAKESPSGRIRRRPG